MRFKVAARADEAFSRGLRHRGAVPRGAAPAALAGRLPLPLLRPSRALRAGGSRSLSPVQEADIAHGGHDLPRDQAAADTLVCAIHLIVTAKNGISSVELGRRLGVKQPTAWAVKHKIMAVIRGGDGAYGAGRDGRRLSRRGALRRQAGPRRGGQDALRGGGLDQSRGAPTQAEAGAGQGLPQARDRAWRQALAGPWSGGCDGRPGLLERTRRDRLQIRQSAPDRADRRPAWRRSNG